MTRQDIRKALEVVLPPGVRNAIRRTGPSCPSGC
jgi:hypothetical protein